MFFLSHKPARAMKHWLENLDACAVRTEITHRSVSTHQGEQPFSGDSMQDDAYSVFLAERVLT